ncbi:aminotransferase class I/II-fold pyridoxal phosphate-dependent enzyme, partial [bacterium]|nr:aminotransferase class I/II-fold pyridoxal phosphate-dependent enzyme [candidate division CSSED10-310 bacterium]
MMSDSRHVSKRMKSLGTENAFVVLAEVNKLIAEGKPIISFCIGQPDFPTPENICNAAHAAIDAERHGYTPSPGIMPLREAIAADLTQSRGIPVTPESVVVAAGAKPFIGYTIFAVTDYGTGDEVLYPNPGFPIYESQIKASGAVPVQLPLLESKAFNFDMETLKARISDKTRLLILCSPQNPTGGVLSRGELETIAELCIKHNIWVFSDEVYSRLVYDGE